jgi:hypothetical protein
MRGQPRIDQITVHDDLSTDRSIVLEEKHIGRLGGDLLFDGEETIPVYRLDKEREYLLLGREIVRCDLRAVTAEDSRKEYGDDDCVRSAKSGQMFLSLGGV